ncbi:MAG: serine hydrolase [Cyclobacteriaceae bacterium]
MKKVLMALALGCTCTLSAGQDQKTQWVDSVFNKLRIQEKIGQLFMIKVDASASDKQFENWAGLVRSHDPGAIFVSGGSPSQWAHLHNLLQRHSRVPLLVAAQSARGPGEVFDSLMTFQKSIAIGALENDSLVTALGKQIGTQLRLLGIHMNFAPNADINLVAENFSEYLTTDKHRAGRKALALARGLQDAGVIATATHTAEPQLPLTDSTLLFSIHHLDTSDFLPYQHLIQNGIKGFRTSHLHFSTQERKKAVPASVSSLFINEILRKRYGYQGLLITDVPYLQLVSRKKRPGEAEALAFEIGNDIIIDPGNLNQSVKKIQKLIKKNPTLRLQFEASVKRILAAKYDVGLTRKKPDVPADNIVARVNTAEAEALKWTIVEASTTILQNEGEALPIRRLDDQSFASLSIGKESGNEFQRYLSKYARFSNYHVQVASDTIGLFEKLKSCNTVVIGIHSARLPFENGFITWINRLSRETQVIVCAFGSPFVLSRLEDADALIAAYADEPIINGITAQIVFGARVASGVLPVQVGGHPVGTQHRTQSLDRLAYGIPSEVGMDLNVLQQIKRITTEAVDSGATPGGIVLVARKGKVVWEQPYGWQTYENKVGVSDSTIYDLASITKVAATLQAVMFLEERGMIHINKKASTYLPELQQSNKKDFTLKDILTHQAGLWPYLPFWQQTMKDTVLLPQYYTKAESSAFPYVVSEDLFATQAMKDSLWQWIIKARVREKIPRVPYDYRYSDMGFYILQHLAEALLNQPLEDFLDQNIYGPMGAYTTGYLPLTRFPRGQIAPTEDDRQFRKSTLVGYVHDQGAAMHGGIAGHAGLFSSANDLAKLGQMWLQGGSYGGLRYFRPSTLEKFTRQQYESSRRGLGWDKPTASDWNGPTSLFASPRTFGHTGFTGTSIWVDPEFELVYVFLSNRVHPDMNNGKLLSANIRPRVQDVVYQSIFEYCKRENSLLIETKAP